MSATPQELEDVRVSAQLVVDYCKANGVHLTIESKSLTPLAMGNLDMIVAVRAAHGLSKISKPEPAHA